jgi:hypothetical protein
LVEGVLVARRFVVARFFFSRVSFGDRFAFDRTAVTRKFYPW